MKKNVGFKLTEQRNNINTNYIKDKNTIKVIDKDTEKQSKQMISDLLKKYKQESSNIKSLDQLGQQVIIGLGKLNNIKSNNNSLLDIQFNIKSNKRNIPKYQDIINSMNKNGYKNEKKYYKSPIQRLNKLKSLLYKVELRKIINKNRTKYLDKDNYHESKINHQNSKLSSPISNRSSLSPKNKNNSITSFFHSENLISKIQKSKSILDKKNNLDNNESIRAQSLINFGELFEKKKKYELYDRKYYKYKLREIELNLSKQRNK